MVRTIRPMPERHVAGRRLRERVAQLEHENAVLRQVVDRLENEEQGQPCMVDRRELWRK